LHYLGANFATFTLVVRMTGPQPPVPPTSRFLKGGKCE
jgi:hypothetical protein